MTCPLCRTRKAKRRCPGVEALICSVCCGSKRLVEIACPPTCVYLAEAQRHPAAMVRRQQEEDVQALLTALGPMSEGQLQLFFLLHSAIAEAAKESPLVDADVAEASGALAATLESAAKGIIYEQHAPSPGGERLRRQLHAVTSRMSSQAGPRAEHDLRIVLGAISRAAGHQRQGVGSGTVAYLTLVARLLQQRPPDAPPAAPRIIIP